MTAPVDSAVRLDGVQVMLGARCLLQLPRLVIAAGERVAIVGANGAGKSTLLRVIAGQLRPNAGQVQLLGRELWSPRSPLSPAARRALRRDVGLLMQGLHLVGRLSARENVLIGALGRPAPWHQAWRSWLRCPTPALRDEAGAALAALGLQQQATTRADRLSGGERQKVGLARLQLQRPLLVLADEPTAALDPQAVKQVCALLQATAAAGTLVSVVHHAALLPQLATRVIGLQGGMLAWDLPLADVDDTRLAALYGLDRPE